MSLTGNVELMPLADLLQVKANNRRTCAIVFKKGGVQGRIFFDQGALIHAECGSLVGEEAVHALLHANDIEFEVETITEMPLPSIDKGLQTIILEAAQFQDELARAGFRKEKVQTRLPQPPARKKKKPKHPLYVAVAVVLLSLGWYLFPKSTTTISPEESTQVASIENLPPAFSFDDPNTYEATDLTDSWDQAPFLISGKPPVMPDIGLSMTPTIVCRLLVDPLGYVGRSQIYRSRLEFAALEEVALDAVSKFRFSPGKRDGATVATWINWPVTFAPPSTVDQTQIRIKGSDTIGGALGPALAAGFMTRVPSMDVEVEGLGSSTAFVGLFDGSAQIGASSRSVKEQELAQAQKLGLRLKEYVIGYDGIAVIVHPSNPVHSLSIRNLSRIFTGEITNWQSVGGPDLPIQLISRPSYSGTHSFFKTKVLRKGDKNGPEDFGPQTKFIEHSEAIADNIAIDPRSIAYLGLGWASPKVKVLKISLGSNHPPVAPTLDTIRKGTYPIYRPLLMYTRQDISNQVKSFIKYTLSENGQALVKEHGFIACDTPQAILDALEASNEESAHEHHSMTRIWFPHPNAVLNPKALNTLGDLAPKIKEQNLKVVLIGHADAEGDAKRNQTLAQYRALSVATFFRKVGIDSSCIEILEGGDEAPLASNKTAMGRAENRRVDVYLTKQ